MPPPNRTPIRGLLESSLYVADPDRSRRFYEETFGFSTLVADENFCALSIAEGQVLLLFRHGSARDGSETSGGSIPGHDGAGDLHIAFAIAREDLAAWEERLGSRGVPLESRVEWPRGGKSIYFRDPDHHLVELATPGLWQTY